MTSTKKVSLSREVLIQRWQRQLLNRTHINFQDFMHLLRQQVMNQISNNFFSCSLFFLI